MAAQGKAHERLAAWQRKEILAQVDAESLLTDQPARSAKAEIREVDWSCVCAREGVEGAPIAEHFMASLRLGLCRTAPW